MLRCFPFHSRLKPGETLTTWQYMSCQTSGNLQFKPLLKKFSIAITLTWETRAVKKYHLYRLVSLVLFRWLKNLSNIHFQRKRRFTMVAFRKVEIPFYRGYGWLRGMGYGSTARAIGRTTIAFLREYVAQLQNIWVLIHLNLVRRRKQRLLVVEKFQERGNEVEKTKPWENS